MRYELAFSCCAREDFGRDKSHQLAEKHPVFVPHASPRR
jgi:hypothetical protein